MCVGRRHVIIGCRQGERIVLRPLIRHTPFLTRDSSRARPRVLFREDKEGVFAGLETMFWRKCTQSVCMYVVYLIDGRRDMMVTVVSSGFHGCTRDLSP